MFCLWYYHDITSCTVTALMLAWGDDDLTMTWQWPTISLQMFSIRDFQVRLAIRQCRSKFNMSVLERSDVVIKKTVHVIFSIPICHHWWCVNTVQYTLYLYIHDRWEERGYHTQPDTSLSLLPTANSFLKSRKYFLCSSQLNIWAAGRGHSQHSPLHCGLNNKTLND